MAGQTAVGRLQDTPLAAGQRGLDQTVRGHNAGGAAYKDVRIVVDTAADATAYGFTVAGEAIAITSGAGATKTSIRDQLIQAVNQNPNLGQRVYASLVASDQLKLVGRVLGDDFGYSEADSRLTSTVNTAAADFEDIEFGIGVMYGATARTIQKPTASAAVPQVTTLTPGNPTADENILIDVLYDADGDGVPELYHSPTLNDGTPDVQEIVEAQQVALDALLGPLGFTVTENNTVLTITGPDDGSPFEVAARATDASGAEGATTLTLATPTAAVAAAFTRPLAGVAVRRQFVRQDSDGASLYEGGDEVPVCLAGPIPVLLDAGVNPAPGDEVWVRCTAGAGETVGAFRTDSDSGDALRWTRARWLDGGAQSGLGGTSVAWIMISP